MNTIAEIEAVLPGLSAEELLQLQRAVHRQLLKHSNRIVYQDSYGAITEPELIISADKAFQVYDEAESKAVNRVTL